MKDLGSVYTRYFLPMGYQLKAIGAEEIRAIDAIMEIEVKVIGATVRRCTAKLLGKDYSVVKE